MDHCKVWLSLAHIFCQVVQYCRHQIPAPVDRMSASAWLNQLSWVTCQKISKAHK